MITTTEGERKEIRCGSGVIVDITDECCRKTTPQTKVRTGGRSSKRYIVLSTVDLTLSLV